MYHIMIYGITKCLLILPVKMDVSKTLVEICEKVSETLVGTREKSQQGRTKLLILC